MWSWKSQGRWPMNLDWGSLGCISINHSAACITYRFCFCMYKLDKTFDKAIFSNFGGKIHTGNYKSISILYLTLSMTKILFLRSRYLWTFVYLDWGHWKVVTNFVRIFLACWFENEKKCCIWLCYPWGLQSEMSRKLDLSKNNTIFSSPKSHWNLPNCK